MSGGSQNGASEMNIILSGVLTVLGLIAIACGLGGKVADGANPDLANGVLLGGVAAALVGAVWLSQALR